MVLRTSSSEPPSEDEGSANESVPLDSPRPSPAQQLSGQQRQAQQPQPQLPQQPLRSPTRTTIEVEASSGAEDDGGTLRIKDLDTGREMQIKQACPLKSSSELCCSLSAEHGPAGRPLHAQTWHAQV